MMDGPPISPREILFTPSGADYGIAIGTSLAVLSVAYILFRNTDRKWTTRFFLVSGLVFLLTLPWISTLHTSVFGAYPTIDKEGSLLFFENGVHKSLFTQSISGNTGLQLIGVHLGHLWVVQFFALFVPTYMAFNCQILFNLIFNSLSFWWWIDQKEESNHFSRTLIISLVIGAQLHVFRDIHWYTIEKSSLFPIFIYWGLLDRYLIHQEKGWRLPVAFAFAIFINFYWGILLALLTAILWLSSSKSRESIQQWLPIISTTCIGLIFAILQITVQSEQHRFANPEDFFLRARLDSFNLFPMDWNRMGIWRPINIPLVILGMHTGIKRFKSLKHEWILFTIFLLLSTGPFLSEEVINPIYSLFTLIPGMWRFAKPEIFFLIVYALIARWALIQQLSPRKEQIFGLFVVIIYLLGLYGATAFPYQTIFIESTLSTP